MRIGGEENLFPHRHTITRGRMLIWADPPEPERRERFLRELEYADTPEPEPEPGRRWMWWVDPPEPDRGRILRELKDLWVHPPPFCRPGASPVTDLLHFEVVIDGPDGTPYAGGTFPVDVQIFGAYPMHQPPRITFKTKIYHPNIDSEGEIFLDILRPEHWRPVQCIWSLLTSIVSVLYDPMLGYPVNGEAAYLYKNDIERYEEVATAWTWEYSSTPVVSYRPSEEDKPWLDYCKAVAAMCYADEEEKRLRRREAYERWPSGYGVSLLWKRVLAFLQGWSVVAMPFAAFRRRFLPVSLPQSN